MTVEAAREVIPAVVAAVGDVPLEFHAHCTNGLAPYLALLAVEHGVRFIHTGVPPLADGDAQPSVFTLTENLRARGYAVDVDLEPLHRVSEHFELVRRREGLPAGSPKVFDASVYEHQVPGGMISNLRSQLATMKMESRLPEILEEAARVRRDLGYPILVSPFAQYIITQSVLNVVQGERYKTIPEEVRKYARGFYGRLASAPSAEFLERAGLRAEDVSVERAAATLPPALPALRARLGASASDEDLLLAAFYEPSLLSPLKKPPAPYSFRTTPLLELVRYLAAQPDVRSARLKVEDAEIILSN
jgi:oxaloacetate decarboxylase alpha subunit